MPEYFDPKNPDIGYNGRDQDPPGGVNIGNSEALRALGGVLAGDQGFENTPDAQDREYTAQVLTAGLSARLLTLEGKMAEGAEYSDNFNRDNSSNLGSPNPGAVPAWITFGHGQPLEIIDQAAQLNPSAPFNLVDDGTRFALCPQAASSPNYTVVAIVHPLSKSGKVSTKACTTIYGRCNAAGTEGVYVDFYGGRCELGRFTRSGNSVNRTQWKSNTELSYNFSSTPELRMKDNRYVVVVSGVELIVHDDVSGFPVDGNHKFSMFSCEAWTGFFGATPEFSAGLTGFAIRGSEFTAIEDAKADAGAALEAAQGAQDAIGTVVEDATAAATSAAEAAAAAIGAAQQQSIDNTQAAIIKVQAGLPVVPYDHCMTNHECTFDQILRRKVASGISGNVSSVSGSSWSTHDHVRGTVGSNTGDRTLSPHGHSDSFSLSKSDPMYLPPQNSVEGGFIRAKWAGGRASIVYALGTVPSSSPNPLYIYISRMNPDDGSLLLEHVSPDQTAAITGPGEQIYNLPDEIVFDTNESIHLAIHQPGPSNAQRQLVGIIDAASISREGLLYPPQQATRLISSSPLTEQSVIAADSLTFAAAAPLLWIGIGQPTELPLPDPVTYFEDFSSGSIPATLSRQQGAAAIVDNGAIMLPGGLINDGRRRYRVTAKMARDDHEATGQIRTPTSEPAYLRVRSYVDVEVRASGVKLAYRPFFGGGVLASQDFTVDSGDVFRLRAAGNVFTVAKLTGTDTWSTVLTYPDTTNAIPRGAAYRYIEIGLDRSSFVNSGGWEFILARDTPEPE
ncbi:hypothetical protein [Rhodococcus sp. KRD162]|uniref:DUF7257 domain-containing protein n=1 Tax=Rhodococcus sp. KRD162 TaxID=2729725 RepID=UPI0019D1D085|nr:hypothetical protein [Rhodococcus sp. KRD162]